MNQPLAEIILQQGLYRLICLEQRLREGKSDAVLA